MRLSQILRKKRSKDERILDATYNRLVSLTKAATFVLLALVIYFTEYPKWLSYFIGSTNHIWGGFIMAAISLSALGAILKRKIITAYAQLSKNNIILGTGTLTAAALIYVLSTIALTFPANLLMPLESLILFGIGYILLRFDARLVRSLLPLFAIVVTVPLAPLLASSVGNLRTGAVVAILMVALFGFFLFAGSFKLRLENLKLLAFPAVMVLLAFVFLIFGVSRWFLFSIPAVLIVTMIPRLGEFVQPPSEEGQICPGHREEDGKGFCSVCGRKYYSLKRAPSSGFLGLAIALIVLALFLTIQIPLLTMGGSGPQITSYHYYGSSSQEITATPANWLVNSSAVLIQTGNTYGLKLVYVPAIHPEVKNYTMYFEVSPQNSNSSLISLGALPGLNQISSDLSLEGFTGSLITYTGPNDFCMIVFNGQTTYNFLNGSNFYPLTESVSYVRNFTGVSTATAQSEVLSDINSTFIPVLASESSAHSWADFVFRAGMTFNALSDVMLVFLSSSAIIVGTFLVKQSDYKLDSFLTRASDTDEKEWDVMSKVFLKNPKPLTLLEISTIMKAYNADQIGRLEKTLERLGSKSLIEKTIFVRKYEILYGWRGMHSNW